MLKIYTQARSEAFTKRGGLCKTLADAAKMEIEALEAVANAARQESAESLQRERELADRLAKALEKISEFYYRLHGGPAVYGNTATDALAAYREARK